MKQLNWIQCSDGRWCDLLNLDLSNDHFDNLAGVYAIWHEGVTPRYVRVGQGIVRERLAEHQSNPRIAAYSKHGPLRVTWAKASVNELDGLEAYLAQACNPLEGKRYPACAPIRCNLP